jgi:toxin ParE1/3/4
MKKVVFLPRALDDVRETAIYLALETSDTVAARFLDAAESVARTLAGAPGIGRLCSFRNPQLKDLRRLPVSGFDNWLVFYRASKERIEVVRILHGARDIDSIFEEDE